MEVNGWGLFQYPVFVNPLKKLTKAVEQLSISQPDTYKEHPKTKLMGMIYRHVTETIPRNSNAPEFRQADTLGPDNPPESYTLKCLDTRSSGFKI
jgi:toxin YhaV